MEVALGAVGMVGLKEGFSTLNNSIILFFSSQGRGTASQKKKKATSKWEFSLCDVERFVGRGVTRVSVEKKYNLRDLPT